MAILSVFARFCAAALVLAVAPMLFGEMAHARTGGSAVAVVPQHSLIRDGARGRVVWPMAEASPSGPSKRPSASAACDGDGPIQACKTHPRNTGHLGVPASHNAYADRTSLLAYHHQQVGVRPTISLRSAHLHASTMDPRTNGDEDGLQFSHQLNDPGRDRCAGPGLHATRGVGAAAPKVLSGIPARITNAANHIFGSNLAKHKLGGVLGAFEGDATAATYALENATQVLANQGAISGFFKGTVVEVAGFAVTVQGRVINGVAHLSTAFIP